MSKWTLVSFNKVFSDDTKSAKKIMKQDYLAYGIYPIVDQGQSYIAGFSNNTLGLYKDVPTVIFGDHTRVFKYIDTPFFLGADGVKLLKPNRNLIDTKYAYHLFLASHIPDTGYNRHYKYLKELIIPLPPLEEQKRIAVMLDKAQSLIDLRKKQITEMDELVKSKFIEMFGAPEINPMEWPKCKLSKLIIRTNNGMARRGNNEDGNIVLRLVELQDGYIDYSNPNRINLSKAEHQRYLLEDGDFLFARVNGNPNYVGRCAVFNALIEPVYHNDHIIRVHFDEAKLNGLFASALINSSYGRKQMHDKIKTSAGQYTINQEGIGAVEAILPPIELQNQFAYFVEQVEVLKSSKQKAIEQMETLYNALMQQAFS